MNVRVGLKSGAALGWERLKSKVTAAITAAAIVLAAIVAVAERQDAPQQAAGRLMAGALFGLFIPLVALEIVSQVLRRRRLDEAAFEVVRLGAQRRASVAGLLSVAASAAMVVNLLTALVAVSIAHVAQTAGLRSDLLTVAWLTPLTTTCYVGLFALASSFGKRGRWRSSLWLADLWLGTMAGHGAVIFPRAHTLNVLSTMHSDFPLSSSGSIAALLLLAGAFTLTALVRVAR